MGRITMDHWREEMIGLMDIHNPPNYLNEKYVDNYEVVTENLAPESRWNRSKITVQRGICQGRPPDQETPGQHHDVSLEGDGVWNHTWASVHNRLLLKQHQFKVAMIDFLLWKESETDADDPRITREVLKYTLFKKQS